MSDRHDKDKDAHGGAKHDSHGGGHGGGGGHEAHGGGGHDEEEHAGAPEWLISFADNVALMMGFFVILLALTMAQAASKSSGSEGGEGGQAGSLSPDMLDFAISVREAFNNPVDVDNPRPVDLPLVRRVLERAKEGYTLNEGFAGREHDVQSPDRGSVPPEPAAVIEFDFQSSQLTRDAEKRLTGVADYFQGVRLVLEIRGHVSAQEASQTQDRGMSLSFQRSLAAGQFLASHGMHWNQMRIQACGDNERRRKTAYGREANTLNERVEIVPTDEAVPQ